MKFGYTKTNEKLKKKTEEQKMERKKNCNETKKLKYLKGVRGITLIALVITIVVLLILAGVTIATLTGENGILTRANDAKEKTEQAEKDEKTNLSRTEDLINQYVDGIEVEQVTDENPGVLETEGTDTYIINSIEDLVVFASNVREGNTYEGQTVKLGLSLDFNSSKSYVDPFRTDYEEYGYDGELKTLLTSGEGFKPIGTTYDADISTNYFSGIFDGNNKTIYNLYQNIEFSESIIIAGLFSTIDGEIKKLKLDDINITGITNNSYIVLGGIVGRNLGLIEQCSTSGKIIVQANGVKSIYVAGIVGQSLSTDDKINQCSSNVEIEVNSSNTNNLNVAGIGQGREIKNCYFTGKILVTGENSGTKNITAINGINCELISNCYNLGKIEVYFENEEAGDLYISGIVLGGAKNIENCYNLGEIKCNNNKIYISGIEANAQNGNINNCYNTGNLKASGNTIVMGALAGYTTNQTISNSKWLTGTAEKAIGNEATNVTKNNIEEVSNIEDMPTVLSVINFENCFKEDTNNINNGYPILSWQ